MNDEYLVDHNYNKLGFGFLESVYQKCLMAEGSAFRT